MVALKRNATSMIQLIVKMINGTFEFFIVGRVGTKFNQFACKPHKWSSSSSHQPSNSLHCCYRMSKNIKKSTPPEIQKLLQLSQVHQRQTSYFPSLKLGRTNINVVKFTISSSKIFISVQSILNRFTSALVNNVEGKIMVLWGQNRRKTTQWLCDKFETSQRREIIDDK